MKYETECKNAVTGEITFVPWTPEQIAAYEAAQMHHRDWSDGSERLAMMGGFEILCPEKHLLFTQMTRMS